MKTNIMERIDSIENKLDHLSGSTPQTDIIHRIRRIESILEEMGYYFPEINHGSVAGKKVIK